MQQDPKHRNCLLTFTEHFKHISSVFEVFWESETVRQYFQQSFKTQDTRPTATIKIHWNLTFQQSWYSD